VASVAPSLTGPEALIQGEDTEDKTETATVGWTVRFGALPWRCLGERTKTSSSTFLLT
jgi:hypothetical protein